VRLERCRDIADAFDEPLDLASFVFGMSGPVYRTGGGELLFSGGTAPRE
jgi:hypothetical protein